MYFLNVAQVVNVIITDTGDHPINMFNKNKIN